MRRPFSSNGSLEEALCGGNQLGVITMLARICSMVKKNNSLCFRVCIAAGLLLRDDDGLHWRGRGRIAVKYGVCEQRERQFGERGAKKSLQLCAGSMCVYCNNWRAASIHIYNICPECMVFVYVCPHFHSLRVCASRVIIIV